jgi:hypothetical protein
MTELTQASLAMDDPYPVSQIGPDTLQSVGVREFLRLTAS